MTDHMNTTTTDTDTDTETDRRIAIEELTDDQIEQVINTRLFQKGLAYSKLADGIGVLRDEDEIYESMVASIAARHGSITTEASVREVLELFCEEVETFTEPLVADEAADAADLEDLYTEGSR